MRLHKGNAIIVGRNSAKSSLYFPEMATYGKDDKFKHNAASGFIYIWGLPARLWAEMKNKQL